MAIGIQALKIRSARLIAGLPLTLPFALAVLVCGGIVLLLLGQFSSGWLLADVLLAIVAGVFMQHVLLRRGVLDTSHRAIGYDALVLVGVVVWVGCNLPFASQHLFTNRDPATYNNAAIWLTNHRSLEIQKPAVLAKLDMPELTAESLGFATDPSKPNVIDAQGEHALPVVLAMAGRVAGIGAMFRLNIAIGGIALLASYGFSRVYIRREWALMATVLLASALPMLFAARDAYTEPLTLTFLFAGMSMAAYAYRSASAKLWVSAGIVLGSAALARIDAFVTYAGIFLGLSLLLAATKERRRTRTAGAGMFVMAAIAVSLLGLLDVALLSRPYFDGQSRYIYPELVLTGAVLVIGCVGILLAWRTRFMAMLDVLTKRWRNKALVYGAVAFFVYLASRPFWFVGYERLPGGAMSPTFAEQTINWLWWYLGPVAVVLAAVGCILLVLRLFKGRDIETMPFFFGFVATALLYIVHPSITGDQPWATRRFLPMVYPGVVFLTGWFVQQLLEHRTLTWRGKTYPTNVVVAVLVTLSVVGPLFVTYPFTFRRLYIPEYDQVKAICAADPQQEPIVWVGESRNFSIQPTRSVCGIDSLGLVAAGGADTSAALTQLAARAAATNTPVLIGFFGDDATTLPLAKTAGMYEVRSISYHEIDHSYKRPPRNVITLTRTIMLGRVANGKITPLQ